VVVVAVVLLVVEEVVGTANVDAARRKSHAVFDLIILDRMAMLLLFVSVLIRGCGFFSTNIPVSIVYSPLGVN
jgi:hypothetical protein